MSIRRLAVAHAPAYRALMLEAYELHPEAFTSAPVERAALPLSWWQERLDDDPRAPGTVLGAFDGETLAGVAGLSFATGVKTRHKARLFGMYVAAACRRAGCGQRLVQAALAEAGGRTAVRVVQLTVTDGNEGARLLYERNGFVVFGVEPFAVAVGDGFVAKLHMWRKVGAGR